MTPSVKRTFAGACARQWELVKKDERKRAAAGVFLRFNYYLSFIFLLRFNYYRRLDLLAKSIMYKERWHFPSTWVGWSMTCWTVPLLLHLVLCMKYGAGLHLPHSAHLMAAIANSTLLRQPLMSPRGAIFRRGSVWKMRPQRLQENLANISVGWEGSEMEKAYWDQSSACSAAQASNTPRPTWCQRKAPRWRRQPPHDR